MQSLGIPHKRNAQCGTVKKIELLLDSGDGYVLGQIF
jgi:hypothetical protein